MAQVFLGTHKQPRLHPRLLVVLYKLMVRAYCWEGELVLNLHPYKLMLMILEGTIPEEKGKHQPICKPFALQWSPATKICGCNSGTELVKVTNQDLIKGPHYEMEPTADNGWMAKNLRLDNPGTWGKTKYYYCSAKTEKRRKKKEKKSSNTMTPENILLYS